MKKIFKNNLKMIIGILISVIISSSITAFAAIQISANQISYNTTSVADALDSMYQTMFSNNYSTTEKVVGKWINGKPLYQKTINIGTLPNNTTKAVDTGLLNESIEDFINIGGFTRKTDKLYYRPLPYVYSTDGTGTGHASTPYVLSNGLWVQKGTTNWEIKIVTGYDRSNEEGYVTIQYTKVSDTTQ